MPNGISEKEYKFIQNIFTDTINIKTRFPETVEKVSVINEI